MIFPSNRVRIMVATKPVDFRNYAPTKLCGVGDADGRSGRLFDIHRLHITMRYRVASMGSTALARREFSRPASGLLP